jgi:hypothetical protein
MSRSTDELISYTRATTTAAATKTSTAASPPDLRPLVRPGPLGVESDEDAIFESFSRLKNWVTDTPSYIIDKTNEPVFPFQTIIPTKTIDNAESAENAEKCLRSETLLSALSVLCV